MKYKTYVVARDFGFAPNPFGKYCTLACCKQKIRENVSVGDWVFGTGSKTKEADDKLIFAMKIDEILKFQEYWDDERFQYKKPILNGSLMQMYGDNIYHKDENGNWIQENSHHSYEDGVVNELNLNRDTSSENVLISKHFYYFGKSAVRVPVKFRKQVYAGRAHKHIDKDIAEELIEWLSENYELGKHDDPLSFDESFERYDGES